MSATITMPPTPTPTAAPPSAPAPDPGWPGLRKRWTIAEFDRLLDKGFFDDGGPEFLWDGEIVSKMPENQPHVNAVENLAELVRVRFPSATWTVNQGKPVELREGYKPQPDLTVMRGPRSTYRTRAPVASDIVIIIEVSSSTYPKNAGIFLRGYALAGIPVYWIVNVPDRRVEVYTEPWSRDDGTAGYTTRRDFGLNAAVPVEGAEPVAVADVLRDSLEPEPEVRP